jgi:hypothetical protein
MLGAALEVLGYNLGTGGGVKWRTRGGIDQATGEDDCHFIRENLPSSLPAPRDVKNEDRSGDVYENIGKGTKCIPLNFTFLQKILPIIW